MTAEQIAFPKDTACDQPVLQLVPNEYSTAGLICLEIPIRLLDPAKRDHRAFIRSHINTHTFRRAYGGEGYIHMYPSPPTDGNRGLLHILDRIDNPNWCIRHVGASAVSLLGGVYQSNE